MEPIPFFAHDLGEPELKSLAEVLQGPILTTGAAVAEFEGRLAAHLGRLYAVGLTSCTAALHLALLELGVSRDSEVITTPLTFLATATAILQVGARPVFVDVEPATGNLDAARVQDAVGERTRAVVPVHLYGQMCDMRALHALALRNGLGLVEDAAHCLEGERDGVRPGQLSHAACFSFYATKSLTSGEGGALVSDDGDLAEAVTLGRLHGMTSSAFARERGGYRHWDMVCMGWKYNMDNLQAALLLPQLERLEPQYQRRARLAARYREQLAQIPGVSTPAVLPATRHAAHLQTIWVVPELRDAVIAGLQARGVGVAVNYRPVHLTTYFRREFGHEPGQFPIAERIGASTLSLPLYASMPEHHVDEVVERLSDVMRAGS